MRQAQILTYVDPGPGVSVSSLTYEYPADYGIPEHAHGSDQLVYATRGVMEVTSGQTVWLIPPQFALRIPARTFHRIAMQGPVSMRTIYLRPGLTAAFAAGCAVLHVSALMRELILEAVSVGNLRMRNRYQCALRDVLVRQIEIATPMPTFITMPKDPRACKVADSVLANAGEVNSLAGLCNQTGVSTRTIQRIFQKELGTDFETWRRQARLMKAVQLLVSGRSIKEVSFAVGYQQSSAFVAVFRKTFGATPKVWISQLMPQG